MQYVPLSRKHKECFLRARRYYNVQQLSHGLEGQRLRRTPGMKMQARPVRKTIKGSELCRAPGYFDARVSMPGVRLYRESSGSQCNQD